jgi:hypothetical protein
MSPSVRDVAKPGSAHLTGMWPSRDVAEPPSRDVAEPGCGQGGHSDHLMWNGLSSGRETFFRTVFGARASPMLA